MKAFILNVDGRSSGIHSLGTKNIIAEKFGMPPISARKWSSIKKIFDNLGQVESTITIADIGGTKVEIPSSMYKFKSPYNQLDLMVIDSIDGVFWSIKQDLLGDGIASNLSMWDKLTNASVKYFDILGSMQIPVVCTCHERGERHGDVDAVKPFMQGTFKDQLGSYFDVILYTKVYRRPNGESDFKWQVVPDPIRPSRAPEKLYEFAKKHGVNGEIDQDFQLIFKNIEIGNPKILIIGSYGSGKTHSLRSLHNVNFEKIGQLPTA